MFCCLITAVNLKSKTNLIILFKNLTQNISTHI